MARHNGAEHRRSGKLRHCGLQLRGKALGQLALALDLHDLGQDGKGDLRCGLRPDGKANGSAYPFYPFRSGPSLHQLFPHQGGALAAAHHPNIGGGLLQDGIQADHITAVSAGHDHKIALGTTGNRGKALLKGLAENEIRPGAAEGVRIFRPVLQRRDRQAQQLCQPYHRRAHMAAAADDQLWGRAKALHKHTGPAQLLHAAGADAAQCRKLPGPERRQRLRPHRNAAAQQHLTALLRAVQHRSQQKICLRGLQCI